MSQGQGRLITVEGIEGAGKSTLVAMIHDWLVSQHCPNVLTREPGGTPLAESLRNILLSPDLSEPIQPETELLLMVAGRTQHISGVIRPALLEGQWVVCDRFVDATYAYQHGGRGLDVKFITFLEAWIAGDCMPHLTFLLDLPPEVGLERARVRGPQDRFEQETLLFFQRVRAAYLHRAKQFPDRMVLVDALQSVDTVRQVVTDRLSELL